MAAPLVAMRLPPPAFAEALQSAWDRGDVVLPLPWDAPDSVIERTIATLCPTRVVHPGRGGRGIETDAVDVGHAHGDPPVSLPDDAALVVSTSGSTGAPKGVVLSHRAVSASTTASVRRLGAATGERFTLMLPLHHVAGIQVLLRSWRCGTDAELLPTGDTTAIAAATADHCSLVPTQLHRLLEAGADLRRWRSILVGGARAEPGLLERARQAGAPIVTSYGMTETVGGCVYDGIALDGMDADVRSDGRIRLRGPALFEGYLADPAATRAAFDDEGWFVTGDRGAIDGEGRLAVLGRADDTIITGGENVSADAVATLLRRDPAIAEAAVLGLPDPEWGERVVAAVVPRDPDRRPTLEQVQERVRAEVPGSHVPRRLVWFDALPRDGMGKIVITRLRAEVERRIDDP